MNPQISVWQQIRNRRIRVILILGFSSGLPLALTSGTLQAWMTVVNIDLATIGLFTLVSLPYTWKFLWAPFLDRYIPPFLGRRRGWIILSQLCLVAGITLMALTSPTESTLQMAVLALIVVTLSATQDIAIDAYRTDILTPQERGFGAALFVASYRLAMLTSGALALVIAQHLGWMTTYLLMAALMSVGILGSLFGPEPQHNHKSPTSLVNAFWHPLQNFLQQPFALWLLVFIVLYKFGDAFAGTLTTTFLLRAMEFELQEVGLINKGMGLAVSILGGLYGGFLMYKLGLYRSLMIFGILQAVTNIGFWLIAISDKSFLLMSTVIGLENIAGGMGTAAFVALLMALCNVKYSATQFALLTALAATGRVYLGPLAGYLLEQQVVDWDVFFLITAVAAIPGLLLLHKMRSHIESLDKVS